MKSQDELLRPKRLSAFVDQQVAKTPGRNSLCPCGSGKKYKHCCLKTDRAGKKKTWLQLKDDRAVKETDPIWMLRQPLPTEVRDDLEGISR